MLMQVPSVLESNATRALNKGKIYISKSSPQCVLDAYSAQFQNDFSLFLKSRAEEMVSAGGRMVLSFMGRKSIDPTSDESCYQWELLAHALMSMVAEVRTNLFYIYIYIRFLYYIFMPCICIHI